MELRVKQPEIPVSSIAVKYDQYPVSREELLMPFTLRERALVVAVGDALDHFSLAEENGAGEIDGMQDVICPLLRAFRDVTGIKWSEAPWHE